MCDSGLFVSNRIASATLDPNSWIHGGSKGDDDPLLPEGTLVRDLWRGGLDDVASEAEDSWLPWECQARVDPNTGVELAEADR